MSMPSDTLVSLHQELKNEGIILWIDGGWGVDALLGRQTRLHGDVDFVVQEKDLTKLVDCLGNKGFKYVPKDDTRPWNFVVGDAEGAEIDVHVINFDANGNGIYGLPENDQYYPSHSFDGVGTINGHRVLCMSPEYQVTNHTGYAPRDKDISDILNLCNKFKIEIPPEYRKFAGPNQRQMPEPQA